MAGLRQYVVVFVIVITLVLCSMTADGQPYHNTKVGLIYNFDHA